MNKFIIILLSILIFFGLIAIGALLFVEKTPQTIKNPVTTNITPTSTIESYILSLTEKNQQLKAELIYQDYPKTLSLPELENYGQVELNTTGDLLWLKCAKPFTTSNPKSSFNNPVFFDPILKAANMELIKNQENNLSVTCIK